VIQHNLSGSEPCVWDNVPSSPYAEEACGFVCDGIFGGPDGQTILEIDPLVSALSCVNNGASDPVGWRIVLNVTCGGRRDLVGTPDRCCQCHGALLVWNNNQKECGCPPKTGWYGIGLATGSTVTLQY
jgi:hypothetical protein